MVPILQGTPRLEIINASPQDFVSLTIPMESTSRFNAKLIAQIIASTSAWKGSVVFTLFEQANTTSLLQSLATTTMKELSRLQAAFTLILSGVFFVRVATCLWRCGFIRLRFVLERSTRKSTLGRIDQWLPVYF